MLNKIKIAAFILLGFYILVCILLYFIQEKLLFFPTVIPKDYQYQFDIPFEEINLETKDDVLLNTVLFKADSSKGVILFLHGNGGAINGWGQQAGLYTRSGYDILYLDYRTYGKSGGKISSEQQLVDDAQLAYDYLKKNYPEENIILSGTSMGTGIATRIAAVNQPQYLILNAPYFSLRSLIIEKTKIVPPFLFKYQFRTNEHLAKVKCPVSIFHGNLDGLIPHRHALSLKELHPKIDLHILENYGHNDLSMSPKFMEETNTILLNL